MHQQSKKKKLSFFLTIDGLIRLSMIDFSLFILLITFIHNILKFGYNQYRNLQKWKQKRDGHGQEAPIYHVRNKNAYKSSTIYSRLDYFDLWWNYQQTLVNSSICIRSKWFERQLHRKEEWLINNEALNQYIESLFISREKMLWSKFSNNRQRLINIVYTCVNKHIPYRCMDHYRKAVCLSLRSFLFC